MHGAIYHFHPGSVEGYSKDGKLGTGIDACFLDSSGCPDSQSATMKRQSILSRWQLQHSRRLGEILDVFRLSYRRVILRRAQQGG